MNNELVPDLEICQEAKAKGVVIESMYLWCPKSSGSGSPSYPFEYSGEYYLRTFDKETQNYPNHSNEYGVYSAPLTDEILKVLPEEVEFEDSIYYLKIEKYKNLYRSFYMDDNANILVGYFEDKKLSNALLLLAIKLRDENIC